MARSSQCTWSVTPFCAPSPKLSAAIMMFPKAASRPANPPVSSSWRSARFCGSGSRIVLNKPAGLVVHPAAGHHGGTLVNALLHHCKGQLSGIAGVARPGIVHRLDMDTSGCIVVAKTNEAHLNLAAQFEERRTTKIYRAIVCGELAHEKGEIQVGIARHPTHRKRMAA